MSEPRRFQPRLAPWRQRAARVVEELFPTTPVAAWDDLLALRQAILHGHRWDRTLDHFLRCRERFEKDHYLPFFRLRKLLENHLRLTDRTAGAGESLPMNLWRHRGFDDLCRRVRRERARHHDATAPRADTALLEVVEA